MTRYILNKLLKDLLFLSKDYKDKVKIFLTVTVKS